MTEEEENTNRPKSLADLLARNQSDVSVKYIPHLQDAQNDGLGDTQGTAGVNLMSPEEVGKKMLKSNTPSPDPEPSQTTTWPTMDFPPETNPTAITNQSQLKSRPNPNR